MNFPTCSATRKYLLLLAVLATAAGLVAVLLLSYKWNKPRTAGMLAGRWIGISENGLYTYRLQLDADGTGLFAFKLTDGDVELYRVTAWRLNGRFLAFDVRSTQASLESVRLDGSVEGTRIGLRVRGEHWKDRLLMWDEDKILNRILSLGAAMNNSLREPATGPPDIKSGPPSK